MDSADPNGLTRGLFASRVLDEDEQKLFESIWERLSTDFLFNKSCDVIQCELVAIYVVKLHRAVKAGDAISVESFDKLLRCHLKDLKATRIVREPDSLKTPTTSPAEWAAALLDKVGGSMKLPKARQSQENAEIIADNTEEAEIEETESQGVSDG